MQVALVTAFGGPEVLVPSQAPDPVAGPGQAVIDVTVADVLWVETMIRSGRGGDYFTMTPPYVPGNGVAGRVRSVGEGVDPAWVGREAPGWVEQARTALGGAGADVILDNIGGQLGLAAFEAIAPGGRFSAHGTPSGQFAPIDLARAERSGVTVRGIRDVQHRDGERTRRTEQALAEVAAGHITPVIGQTFSLAKAADAHAAIESRTVFGKTLLIV